MPSDVIRAQAVARIRASAQRNANEPKHGLMKIADNLERLGDLKGARDLRVIVARLEAWQSRP